MNSVNKYFRSIYWEIGLLLLVAASVAVAFFFIVNFASDAVIDSYIGRSNFNQNQSAKYADLLQDYIDTNEVVTFDDIDVGFRRKTILDLQFYDNGILVYDNTRDGGPVLDESAPGYYYDINFNGKVYRARINGNFDYAMHNTALIAEIIVSIAPFVTVILLGTKRKIDYLRMLGLEVELLEGGIMDKSITVKGNDEVAELAKGLESMRVSLKHQMDEAESLSITNQTMVTQLSHDLRTPLTSLLLYAEILQKRPDLSHDEQQEYIGKIIKRIHHMKDLSDHLLSYTQNPTVPVHAISVWECFYDELSDLCGYLEEQNLTIVNEIDWSGYNILANDEYTSRIVNNISSNIMKYAGRDGAIKITGRKTDDGYVLSFSNRKARYSDASGTGIGIESIRAMMLQLGGKCDVKDSGDEFAVNLVFRLADE